MVPNTSQMTFFLPFCYIVMADIETMYIIPKQDSKEDCMALFLYDVYMFHVYTARDKDNTDYLVEII